MVVFQVPATRTFAKGRASGGTIALINKSLCPKLIEHSPDFLKIRVTILGKKMWWIVAYLPPQLNQKSRLVEFEKMICGLHTYPVVLMGDLNARIGDFSNGLTQLVKASGLPISKSRNTKDKARNTRGRWLIKLMELTNL